MYQLNGLSVCLGSKAYAREQPQRDEQRYEKYVVEGRNLSTAELRRTLITHDSVSLTGIGNLARRLFNDSDFPLKIKALRQVLQERSEQSFF